jgi:hypothetical protein
MMYIYHYNQQGQRIGDIYFLYSLEFPKIS